MYKTFLVMLLLLLVAPTIAAQESILLKGRVLADSLDGTSVNIINLTKGTGTVTSTSGAFEIEVQVSDTLYFSSVQYELVEQEITADIYSSGYLEVRLEIGINILQEVMISNIDLTGNLKTDLSKIPVFDQGAVGFPLPNRPKMTSIERKLYSASNSGGLGILINYLSGRTEMLKKARENEELRILVLKGMDAVPLSVFVDELEIPEEHVINFVYFCAEEDPAFKGLVQKKAPLKLIEYYRSKAAYFLKNRLEL